MNYPPPFGNQPPGMPPRMPPAQYHGGFVPASGMPYPPFQQAPPVMPPAQRPFQSPPMYARPTMYQAQQPVYHAPPVLKPPPPAAPEIAPTTIYVGNITDRYPDFSVAEILSACGPMLSWKRVKGHDFKLQAFGFCEYEKPDGAARASRLLNDLLLGNDRKLVIKTDPKTQERIDEWMKNKCVQSGKRFEDVADSSNPNKYVDEKTLAEDKIANEKIAQIINAANVAADEADANKPAMAAELPKKTLHGLDVAEDRRHLINKEIKHFRWSDEKSGSKNKQSSESAAAFSAVSPRSPSQSSQTRSPSRQRDEAASTASTQHNAAQGTTAPTASTEPPIDEEEAAERRRAERRAREKAERYAERLKAWESRERDKGRQYSRSREKDADTKRKQESDARKLKEFLEDYDDVRDDVKYYRGSALSQRLKEREREIESDARDRKREKEEMDDVRRKLRDQGCRNLEEEMEKLERATTEHLLPRLRGDENSPSHTHAQEAKATASPHSDSTPSLDQHIQLLSSKLNRQEGADTSSNGDEKSMDGITGGGGGGRQFVPARFEPAADSGMSSPQQQQQHSGSSSSRKRPDASVVDEERSDAVGGDAATLSLKMSLNKAKRLAAAISVVAEMGQSSTTTTGMNRLGPMTADGDSASASSAIFMSEESKKERIQQLIQSIPSAKSDLFAYQLDWGVVDKLLMEKRVRPWIDKKIVEYIGEKEPTLSEFLCQKVLARTAPEKILSELFPIFDEDAELFVVKLWRLLIYETEARKLKINQF